MFITLKTLLRTLVLPPTGLLILAVLGVLLARLAATQAARRVGWGLLAVSLATLWLLATPAVADRLERAAERCPVLDLTHAVQAQAIVILGGGEIRMGAPEYGGPAAGMGLLERLSYGAYLARQTQLPVLVSGTSREVLAMRSSLQRDFGVQVRWADDQSRDTFQNAEFSARILKAQHVTHILLVTSANHEWRAVQEFTSAGLTVVPAPAGSWVEPVKNLFFYLPGAVGLQRSAEALYELLGDLARQFLALSHLRRQAP
jgi:uncharacterized SAM-binding protein YcdF (DUF218 family)